MIHCSWLVLRSSIRLSQRTSNRRTSLAVFSLMTRFGKLVSTETMLRLYKAFVLPHFCYCSMVWHFSSKQDSDKLDLLSKRILRFTFKDFNSECNNLLKRAGTANLRDTHLQNMIFTTFKCLHFSDYPRYLQDMFHLRSSTYFLRGHMLCCLNHWLLVMVLILLVTWQQYPGTLFLTITALFLILLLFDDWYLLGTNDFALFTLR